MQRSFVTTVAALGLAQPDIEECMLDAMRKLQFAKPSGGGIVVVTYPYLLESDDPQTKCQ